RGLRPENDGGLRRQNAAIAVRQRDFAVFHLTRTAFAAKLAQRLDQKEQPVHPWMTVRKSAAIGIDGKAALRSDTSSADERAPFALLAKAEICQAQDSVDCDP